MAPRVATSWRIAAAEAYCDDYPGREAYEDSLRELELDLRVPGTEVLCCKMKGELVAGAMVRPNLLLENCFELTWVFVVKLCRGRGFGSRIISKAIKKIENELLRGQRGSILVAVLDHNVSLYRKFGFELGVRLHDGVMMARIANPGGPIHPGSSIFSRARSVSTDTRRPKTRN